MNKTITLLIVGVILLALLLMVLNSFISDERPRSAALSSAVSAESAPSRQEEAPARPGAHAPEERAAVQPPPPASGGALPPPRPVVPVAPQAEPEPAPSTEGIAVKTVPAQIDPGLSEAPAAQPAQPPAPRPAAPKAPAEPAPKRAEKEKSINNIVVYVTQEGATVRLGADRPLVYKSMLLNKPDRLVLDFEGHWSTASPEVPQNKLVKSIRVGRQAEATRMVIDLHKAPAAYRLIKTSPQGLDIRLR